MQQLEEKISAIQSQIDTIREKTTLNVRLFESLVGERMLLDTPKEEEFLELHLLTVKEMEKRLDALNLEISNQMEDVERLSKIKTHLIGAL